MAETPDTASILQFKLQDDPTRLTPWGSFPLWDAGKFLILGIDPLSGTPVTDGVLTMYDMGSADATVATLVDVLGEQQTEAGVDLSIYPGAVSAATGNTFWKSSAASAPFQHPAMVKVTPEMVTSIFGDPATGVAPWPPTSTDFTIPSSMAVATETRDYVLLTYGAPGVEDAIAVMDGTTMAYTGLTVAVDEDNALVISAAPAAPAVAYAIGLKYWTGGLPENTPWSLYRLTFANGGDGTPDITKTKMGEFAPHDVDPTWDNFLHGNVSAIYSFIDETDGNIITSLTGVIDVADTDPVWVKLNASTGAVMWVTTTALPMGAQKVTDGHLFFYENLTDPDGQVVDFDTTDATSSPLDTVENTTVAPLAFEIQPSFSNDATGQFFLLSLYQGVPGPTPVPPSDPSWWDPEDPFAPYFPSWATFGSPKVSGVIAQNLPRFQSGNGGGEVGQYYSAGLFGYPYESRGQLLRPILDAGANNGPALGKTRRTHMYALHVHRASNMSVGTSFSEMRPVVFTTAGGTPIPPTTLFNGIVQGVLEDNYSFDSQLAFKVDGAGPCTVLSAEQFLMTQDR